VELTYTAVSSPRRTPGSLTYLQVTGYVAWHFSEAERRNFTPHSERSRQSPARVPGVYEVSWEGQDSVGTQNNVRKVPLPFSNIS